MLICSDINLLKKKHIEKCLLLGKVLLKATAWLIAPQMSHVSL